MATKAGNNCCKLPFKASDRDKGGIQEAIARLANEISTDAAAAAVLSDVAGIFTLKEQRTTLKAFDMRKKEVFASLPTD